MFSLQIKAPTTRKLRRRPNDPINPNSASGASDKRRKMAPAQLAYLLDDMEVCDDLRAIERGICGSSLNKNSSGNASSNRGNNNGLSNKRSTYSSPARHSDQSPSRYETYDCSGVNSINCIPILNSSPVHNSSYGYGGWNSGDNQATYEARVEDGKLFYEKRW